MTIELQRGTFLRRVNRGEISLAHAGYARLERVVATVWQGLLKARQAWVAARARNELHQLSDRTLKDIGLNRGQIDSLFR